MIKKVFSKTTTLVIKEAFVFVAIKVVLLLRSMMETFVNQMAGTSEIERLKEETSLVFSEFIINHQNDFSLIFAITLLLLIIAAITILVNDAIKISNIIKENED